MPNKNSLGLVAILTISLAANAATCSAAQAQQRVAVHSDDLRDVFVTAGYAAAFGAATGVALLPFLPGNVSDNMRVVAGGASVGFLLGSALSLYNVSAGVHTGLNGRNGRGNSRNLEALPDDETTYGLYDSRGTNSGDNEPLGALPSNCKQPFGSLVVGCGNRLSLSWPDVAIAPKSLTVSLLHIRF